MRDENGGKLHMELILISDDKLKVILSEADMEAYMLTCDTIDYDNTETRRAFWSILDEAKHQTGFDAAAGRVLIQVYPMRRGGCEMYVTRLCGRKDDEEVACTVSGTAQEEKTALFRFDTLHELTEACFQLHGMPFLGGSRVYAAKEPGGTEAYYLLLYGAWHASFLSEYGVQRDISVMQPYLTEHGSILCAEHAVAAFAGLH